MSFLSLFDLSKALINTIISSKNKNKAIIFFFNNPKQTKTVGYGCMAIDSPDSSSQPSFEGANPNGLEIKLSNCVYIAKKKMIIIIVCFF